MRAIEIIIKDILIAAVFFAAVTVSACSFKFEEEIRKPELKVTWIYSETSLYNNDGGEILPDQEFISAPKYLVGRTNVLTVTVQNSGKYYLKIGQVRCTGGDMDGFTLQDDGVSGAELWPNEKRSVTFLLNLTTIGEKNSEYTIESTNPDVEDFVFSIRQRATLPAPRLTTASNYAGYIYMQTEYSYSGYYIRLYRSTDSNNSTAVNIPIRTSGGTDSLYFIQATSLTSIYDYADSPAAGDLAAGTTYYYSARACSDNLNEANCGEFSTVRSATH